jgi:hypothetical protein
VATYRQSYKARVVARLLAPENSAVEVVSRDFGISAATLEGWSAEALAKASGGECGAGSQRRTAAARGRWMKPAATLGAALMGPRRAANCVRNRAASSCGQPTPGTNPGKVSWSEGVWPRKRDTRPLANRLKLRKLLACRQEWRH